MNRYVELDKVIPIAIQAVVDIVGHGISQVDAVRIVERFEEIPGANVVEVEKGKILMPLTEEELRHLKNDTIAYIWNMEKTKRDKEEFGYFSRKELLKKLEYFLKSFELPVCCCDKRREG